MSLMTTQGILGAATIGNGRVVSGNLPGSQGFAGSPAPPWAILRRPFGAKTQTNYCPSPWEISFCESPGAMPTVLSGHEYSSTVLVAPSRIREVILSHIFICG